MGVWRTSRQASKDTSDEITKTLWLGSSVASDKATLYKANQSRSPHAPLVWLLPVLSHHK